MIKVHFLLVAGEFPAYCLYRVKVIEGLTSA